jgi:hypothetical protein
MDMELTTLEITHVLGATTGAKQLSACLDNSNIAHGHVCDAEQQTSCNKRQGGAGRALFLRDCPYAQPMISTTKQLILRAYLHLPILVIVTVPAVLVLVFVCTYTQMAVEGNWPETPCCEDVSGAGFVLVVRASTIVVF